MTKRRDSFVVEPGSTPRLADIATDSKGDQEDKASAEAEIVKLKERLGEQQYRMYAEGKRSLLICLQALDAGGKDGTIRHVLGAMNPQGTRVHGFKVPSAEEAAHDFLWRAHQHAPARGEVVVFNRSHYEDVLVVRVHGLVPREVWKKRYDIINDFERGLVENGTHILKLYLHVSEGEQLRRFKQRLDDPARHWKISEADYAERELWPAYVEAYEDVFRKTSTKHAPWFIVPADHKWFRNLTVSRIVADELESLDMKLPTTSIDLDDIRRKYHATEREQKALDKKGK